jgi:hypothetical protein
VRRIAAAAARVGPLAVTSSSQLERDPATVMIMNSIAISVRERVTKTLDSEERVFFPAGGPVGTDRNQPALPGPSAAGRPRPPGLSSPLHWAGSGQELSAPILLFRVEPHIHTTFYPKSP